MLANPCVNRLTGRCHEWRNACRLHQAVRLAQLGAACTQQAGAWGFGQRAWQMLAPVGHCSSPTNPPDQPNTAQHKAASQPQPPHRHQTRMLHRGCRLLQRRIPLHASPPAQSQCHTGAPATAPGCRGMASGACGAKGRTAGSSRVAERAASCSAAACHYSSKRGRGQLKAHRQWQWRHRHTLHHTHSNGTGSTHALSDSRIGCMVK